MIPDLYLHLIHDETLEPTGPWNRKTPPPHTHTESAHVSQNGKDECPCAKHKTYEWSSLMLVNKTN